MAQVRISDNGQLRTMVVEIERQFDTHDETSAIRKAIHDIAIKQAKKWVEENRDKILARMNVDAIANMIMLEVANDIKQEVRKDKEDVS